MAIFVASCALSQNFRLTPNHTAPLCTCSTMRFYTFTNQNTWINKHVTAIACCVKLLPVLIQKAFIIIQEKFLYKN